MGALISVVSTYDPAVVAGAIFNDPGVTVQQASWLRLAEADSSPAGTFSNGPYGIGSGGILTNGLARRVASSNNNGQPNVDNFFPGSGPYCGSDTFDATVLKVSIQIDEEYDGVEVEFILSSMEYTEGRPDPIGIYLDDVLWSIDDSNNRITATSKYLNEEIGIKEKGKFDFPGENTVNRATRYDGSSPPLLVGIPATPGEHTMIFAICDAVDSNWDSALMVKAKGCKDCNPKVRINYVSTTTTTGSTSFTSTTKAIGTESGTVLFGVPVEETTTTTEEFTTTTADVSTTDTLFTATDTTTASESQETSTAISDTDPTDTTTLTSDQSSTVISAVDSTTTANTDTSATTDFEVTTTLSETTDIASSSIQTSDQSSAMDISTSTTATQDSTSMTSSSTVVGSTSSEGSTGILESSTLTEQQAMPTTETTYTSSEVSTTVLPIKTTTSGETSQSNLPDTTSIADIQSTQSTEQTDSLTPSIPDSTSSAVSPTDIADPTNLDVIGSFTFLGCLGSPEGYPSFDLVATSDDMTPSKCVSLANGRIYIGVYDRSCYASDSLESTTLVGEGECDVPCPNAPLLFCGGRVGAGATDEALQRRYRYRRDAPGNILLTVYGASDVEESSSSTLVTEVPTSASTSQIIVDTSVITADVSAPVTESITSNSGAVIVTQPTASSLEFPITSGQAIPFPPNKPVPTSGWLGKNNMTQAVDPVITVSTITYTIVDPQNPSTFKVEEYCSTILYYPCHRCENQDIPPVHMTTIQRQCNACGVNGENSVYLTVPAAVAVPSATGGFKHPVNPLQHGSNPFEASPIETGLRHPKPVIPAKPTKSHYNPLPPVSKTDDSTDGPDHLNVNQPQVHPQDDIPKKPQFEAPKAPIDVPKPVDQAHPTSQFGGGYEIKTTTLPTLHIASEVPLIVSAATMSFPILGIVFFLFSFTSLLNSV
ncbi:hypothetical protein FPOAC2_13007 [Fusarium poae]|uniref:hypothetical protein n=1 Tax=Fusarium poae TaxID=36050 RepID=UPI001CEB777D|nr:hypothetical protein FPOAC1_012648 [Fusarium poae]KAG8667809.1 hypothetical protein FPOAC1_012648 [Fusarium poae]